MARTSKQPTPTNKKNITTGISLPADLFKAVQTKIQNDPEMDFSKHIRRLIRADLESEVKAA